MIDLNAILQDQEALAALLRHVPDPLLHSEVGRRRHAKIVNHSGGKVWRKHRPNYPRCRCKGCNTRRANQ